MIGKIHSLILILLLTCSTSAQAQVKWHTIEQAAEA